MSSYTIEQAIEAIGLGRFQYFIISVAAMAFVADATEMMLLSFLGPIVRCSFNIGPEEEAVLTTIVFVGMSLGGFTFGMLADLYGRRLGLIATAVLCTVGGLMTAASTNFGFMLFSRFVVGMGLGGVAVAFGYCLEFIPAADRGRISVFMQGFWTVGVLMQASLAWISLPTLGWRWLVGLSTLPLFILLLMFIKLPESPRYLTLRGRLDEAHGIMARAAAVNKKALPGQKLTTAGGAEDGGQSALASFKEAFSRGYRRDMFLLLLIWFVNAFAYYGLVLMTTELSMVRQENGRYHPDFQNVTDTGGCDNLFDTSFYSEIFIASFAEVPGLILAMLLVDRLGRKLSQAVFYFGCCLPVLILALVPRTSAGDTMLLFVARGASQGGFTVLYLYTPERFPTRFRSTAMGMCFAFARFGGMVCPFVSQDMVERGEVTGALVILVVTLLTAGACSLLLTVETKDLELDAVAPAQQQQQQQQAKQGGFQNLMEEAGDGQDTA